MLPDLAPCYFQSLATNERVLLNILSEKKDESGTISILVAAGNCCREKNSEVFNYNPIKAMANSIGRDQGAVSEVLFPRLVVVTDLGREVYRKLTQDGWSE